MKNIKEFKNFINESINSIDTILETMTSQYLSFRILEQSDNGIHIFMEDTYPHDPDFIEYMESNYQMLKAIKRTQDLNNSPSTEDLFLYINLKEEWRNQFKIQNEAHRNKAYSKPDGDEEVFFNEKEYEVYELFKKIDFNYKELMTKFPVENDPLDEKGMPRMNDRIVWSGEKGGVFVYKGIAYPVEEYLDLGRDNLNINKLEDVKSLILSIGENHWYSLEWSDKIYEV